MNDLITAATSGLFVEVGKIIEHMKAQQARIADLERQLAEASAPAVERKPIGHISKGMLEQLRERLGVSGYVQSGRTEEFPVALYTAPLAADTDKVREALADKLHNDIMNLPCNASDKDIRYRCGHRDARHAAAELAASMAAQAPVREVPDERLQNWIDLIHDNERSMGDRLQSLSSTFAGLLNGDAVDKYPLRAIREQLEGEPLNAILCPDSWHKVADHGNPPEGLYMAIYKGDGRSLPVALLAYGEYEFEVESDDDDRHVGEIGWAEYSENSDGDYCMVIREVIAYLPVNLDMESLKAIRAALPAAPVQKGE